MASAQHLMKFDPAEHAGNVFEAFTDFIEAFAYEYAAIAKPAPTGTENVPAWKEQDKRMQLLGRFASRNLQRDFVDKTTEEERDTITFKATVDKLLERYRPSQNKILASYRFSHLKQQPLESWDSWGNRVKHEANLCDFSCAAATCTVKGNIIWNQLVCGTSNDEIRKSALNEQWSLVE